jgi:hypothetical protein
MERPVFKPQEIVTFGLVAGVGRPGEEWSNTGDDLGPHSYQK